MSDTVCPGDNLLSVLEQASAGATILIDPNYVADLGHWRITKPVTLACSLPPCPGRVSPDANLPTLNGLVTFEAPQVTWRGIRAVGYISDGTLLTAGPETTLEQVVLLGSPQGQHRGVLANAPHVRITQSHIANIWKDIDTQAIGAWAFGKHHDFDDCYLEASGENIIYGGADAPSESDICEDIEITNCDLVKPLAWMGRPDMTCKNLFELKNAHNVRMRNCRLTNSWANGQTGYAILLSLRNQDGTNPWARLTDILIEDCVMAHLGAGLKILGHDDLNDSAGLNGVRFQRNRLDLDATMGEARQVLIQNGGTNIVIENNTWQGAHLNTFLTFGLPAHLITSAPPAKRGFRYVGNTAMEGEYGIHGEGAPGTGKPVLDMYIPGGYEWENNTIIRDQMPPDAGVVYPEGTTIVPV